MAWESPSFDLTSDDFIITLSHMTGLPKSILDDREHLNLESLRDLFTKRILGQPEAIDCLGERVAMIKAGLCDPTRPTGVFLFAGPTGTGKTEIVKALADFVFGSSDRMIRLDMSEFQSPNSSERILGTPEMVADEGLLTSQVRKQPFTVILLDEIEKSNPNIWNLFLQVFDDGRLTDAHGNTADFRHSIIIMTTNLGATIYSDSGIGFNPSASAFSTTAVKQAIDKTLPKELIRRLAQRLYLLRLAHLSFVQELPRDAYLKIEVISKSKRNAEATMKYALTMKEMYLKWAKARRMRFSELLSSGADAGSGNSCRSILAVSGFGAYLILSPESGLHVFELLKAEKTFERHNVSVSVVSQPEIPPLGSETLLTQAEERFRTEEGVTPRIVRYYRSEPSPLVRDTYRKWRTGRIDLVLDGNFDLFGPVLASGS